MIAYSTLDCSLPLYNSALRECLQIPYVATSYFVCSVIQRLRQARVYQKQQIEIVCLTSQPRYIPEVAILGLNVLAWLIVAVFLAATIVEASAATYICFCSTRAVLTSQ